MVVKFSRSDVGRTNDIIVSLGNSYLGQFIVGDLVKTGEYEGENYWNCFDIYDYNGIRFLYGNGKPMSDNFSHRLFKKTAVELRAVSGWSKEDIEKRKNILDAFCTTIRKGIHDPSPVNSFRSFKKNLIEQHSFFPDMNLADVAKLSLSATLVKDYDRITAYINNCLSNLIKKHPEQFKNLDENSKYNASLEYIIEEDRAKNDLDYMLKKEVMDSVKNDTMFDFVSNNAYRMDKEQLAILFQEMNYAAASVFEREPETLKIVYKNMKETLEENDFASEPVDSAYPYARIEKDIMDRLGNDDIVPFVRNNISSMNKDILKDLIKEFDYAVYQSTEAAGFKSDRKEYCNRLRDNLVEHHDYPKYGITIPEKKREKEQNSYSRS